MNTGRFCDQRAISGKADSLGKERRRKRLLFLRIKKRKSHAERSYLRRNSEDGGETDLIGLEKFS